MQNNYRNPQFKPPHVSYASTRPFTLHRKPETCIVSYCEFRKRVLPSRRRPAAIVVPKLWVAITNNKGVTRPYNRRVLSTFVASRKLSRWRLLYGGFCCWQSRDLSFIQALFVLEKVLFSFQFLDCLLVGCREMRRISDERVWSFCIGILRGIRKLMI